MYEDRVTVYAAQASFFFVISSIPFIMLLLSLSSFIIPDAAYHMMASFGATLPQNIGRFYMDILSELYERPPINLISITAITAFWMASRALSSLRVGISNIYRSHPENTFLRDIAMSIAPCQTVYVLDGGESAQMVFLGTRVNNVNGETKDVLGGTLVFTALKGETEYALGTDAGTYVITPSGYTSDNYEITFNTADMTVGKKALSNSMVSTSGEYTYTGLEQTVTYAVSDIVSTVELIKATDYILSAFFL